MEKQIQISEALYNRLAAQVRGFEAPEQVIDRVLEFYEKNSTVSTNLQVAHLHLRSGGNRTKPPLTFIPSDEQEFKRLLIQKKQAHILICKHDGTIETKKKKVWNAQNFSMSSNLRGNLWSGYLRDWDKKGISYAILAINENDIDEK